MAAEINAKEKLYKNLHNISSIADIVASIQNTYKGKMEYNFYH